MEKVETGSALSVFRERMEWNGVITELGEVGGGKRRLGSTWVRRVRPNDSKQSHGRKVLLAGCRLIVGNTVSRPTIQHLKAADCGDAFGLKNTGSCTRDSGHAVRGESASLTEAVGGAGIIFT